MSTLAPVCATISRMTLPPVPITSRILSLGICSVSIRGARADSSPRVSPSALAISPRALGPGAVGRQRAGGLAQRLGHVAEDVGAAVLGLGQGDAHDLLGDARDLD